MTNFDGKTPKAILADAGVPVTTQRLSILEYMFEDSNHPTAEIIYDALKERLPILSKATVYNTLQTLLKAKIIEQLTIERERARYEISKSLHHHFYCTKCGRIFDTSPPSCNYIKDMNVDGHKIERMQGYFMGECKYCIKSKSL